MEQDHPDCLDPWRTILLTFQPSTFCNIDCSYCYLPRRADLGRISIETIRATRSSLLASDLLHGDLTVSWHSGEPLTRPVEFYEDAFPIFASAQFDCLQVKQTLQTNGTLISDEYCELFLRHDIQVGVSVDGPRALHDSTRTTRNRNGTHARVVEGMRLLREHGVAFGAITVLTRAALDQPKALYDFYVANGVERVGLNIEEVVGVNQGSSYSQVDIEPAFLAFASTFLDLVERDGILHVREFDFLHRMIDSGGELPMNNLVTPFAVINVDVDGNFTTYSPEFLDMPSTVYGNFHLGNVNSMRIRDAAESDRFQTMAADVQHGVENCREACSYYSICKGGSPANKYYELGTVRGTETKHCRYSIMRLCDVFLNCMEQRSISVDP